MSFIPNSKPKEQVVKGRCSSCQIKKGESRTIPMHPGHPVLCSGCFNKRRERVNQNRNSFYGKTTNLIHD